MIPNSTSRVKAGFEAPMNELGTSRDVKRTEQATGEYVTSQPETAVKTEEVIPHGAIDVLRNGQPYSRLLAPLFMNFQYDDQSDAVAMWCQGQMVTKAEIQELLHFCMKLFSYYGDDFAERINREIEEEHRLEEDKRRAEDHEQRRQRAAQRSHPGFVYLMYSPLHDHYKIGRSANPESRHAALRSQHDHGLTLIHIIECQNCVWVEQDLHERYRAKRVGGEWFTLTAEDVADIKAIERM